MYCINLNWSNVLLQVCTSTLKIFVHVKLMIFLQKNSHNSMFDPEAEVKNGTCGTVEIKNIFGLLFVNLLPYTERSFLKDG
jgi:hypothetical protein